MDLLSMDQEELVKGAKVEWKDGLTSQLGWSSLCLADRSVIKVSLRKYVYIYYMTHSRKSTYFLSLTLRMADTKVLVCLEIKLI